MADEPLETRELQEKLDEAIEKAEEAGEERVAPKWTFLLALSTAIVAVLAAIASLHAGNLSGEALLSKNEAVLAQAKASDQWAYYQAKGIKGVIYQTQAEALGGRSSAIAAKFRSEAKRYKDEQADIKEKADELDREVAAHNKEAEDFGHREHFFSLAVTFYQVGIALSAIAAISKRKPLWYLSLLISGGGLIIFARGFLVR
jgi:hypothetical protein